MKKAKIMLMAIAVVGVVGGALAFKANRTGSTVFYSYTTTLREGKVYGICTSPATTLPLTTVGSNLVQTTLSTTTAFNVATCTALVTIDN